MLKLILIFESNENLFSSNGFFGPQNKIHYFSVGPVSQLLITYHLKKALLLFYRCDCVFWLQHFVVSEEGSLNYDNTIVSFTRLKISLG